MSSVYFTLFVLVTLTLITTERFMKIKTTLTAILAKSNLDTSNMETFMPKHGVILVASTDRELSSLTQSIIIKTDWVKKKSLPELHCISSNFDGLEPFVEFFNQASNMNFTQVFFTITKGEIQRRFMENSHHNREAATQKWHLRKTGWRKVSDASGRYEVL